MPVPHFNIKITQRSKGKSAVAGAAYQAGEKLFSEYDQKTKNYTCKKEVVYTEIMLPPNAPPEYADRAALWNSVEEIEKQWNSQLARRFVAALPREVPMELLPQMVKEYCEEHFVSKGMCCDFAIHDPDPPGHNPHCHFMLTMRAIDENGKWLPKSRKVYDLDENGERMLCLVGGQGAGKSTFFRLLAVKDEWFSDDLKKIDDDNVYRKMQGHWIIEMSEMIATANAKSIEDIKSFISRAKETYKVPYETHPADRLRQCVFGGSSNTMDFLPLDRSGNRRFLPIMVHPENAEVHILEDEAASRAFIDMMWAEAMFIYQNFPLKLTLSKDMDKELKELQKQFMPEDTKAGLIQSFLDNFKGTQVCSKLIYAEALNHPFDEPKQWEIREINEIMNNSIEGWKPFSNPRSFAKYGRQRGWERIPPPDNEPSATGSNLTDGFRELTEEEARQMELPF